MKLKQLQGLMPSGRERQQYTLALAFLHELPHLGTPLTSAEPTETPLQHAA